MGFSSRSAGAFAYVSSAIALIAAHPALAAESDSFDSAFEDFELAASTVSPQSSEPPAPAQPAPNASVPTAQAPPPPPARPAPKPIDARFVVSQFVDAPVSGDAPSTARYSGRADGYITVNASRNFSIKLRPEFTWGETSNGEVGLIPGNTALFRPEGAGDFDLSASLQYRWDSGATLEVGKMNLLDTSGALPIVASDGHYGFQNLGIALPPTAIVPNTMTGAMLTIPTEKMIYRAWVFDPDSQYERTGFETAFESGVAFLVAAARRTRIGGMPGVFNFAVVGSTRDTFAVDILPRALTPPPPPIGTFGNESGEIALQLSAYQFIKLYPEARGKGWGILARFQASNGDPTFLDYSGYFGISGNPRFRPQDRFGLAYFHYSLTNELVDDIAFRLPIEDEQGVEAFYTYEFAKGFGLTVNAQVVDSAVAFRDTGLTIGARLTAGF